MTLSNCPSVVSSIEVRVSMPALLTMTSRRPKFETAASIELLEVVHLGDVGLHPDGRLAQLGDLALEFLLGLLVRYVVDDDLGALLGQGEHDGLADARVATGDDRHLAFQLRRHGLPPRALCTDRDAEGVPRYTAGRIESETAEEVIGAYLAVVRAHRRVPLQADTSSSQEGPTQVFGYTQLRQALDPNWDMHTTGTSAALIAKECGVTLVATIPVLDGSFA